MSKASLGKYLAFAGTLLGVLAVDQAVKAIVVANVEPGTSYRLFPGVDITHIRNSGAAFGLFAGNGQVIFWVALVAVVITLLWFFGSRGASSVWYYVALGLIIGGAVGNLTDRIFRGNVVDYIDVGWWPVFNVADIAVVVGVITLMALVLFDFSMKSAANDEG